MKRFLPLICLLTILPLLCVGQIANDSKAERIGMSLEELYTNGYISEEDLLPTKPPANYLGSGNRADCNEAYIPVDGTYTPVPRNDDGSLYIPNMGFTFSFCGTSYTDCYINTNGNISFTQGVGQFSPDGFPYATPMIAPFWADVDTRDLNCGQAHYQLFGNYMIVSWEGVGWYNMQCSPLNTFQVIISDGTAGIIGVGNSIQFRYGDMNWTTGQASGGGPFGGSAATVGYNSGDNINFEQIGRFNVDDSSYDGPFGNNDGVHWLDFNCFVFEAGTGSFSLSCNDIERSLDANCLASITLEDIADVTINGCAAANVVIDVTDFGCDNIGPNTVTVTADVDGVIETCTAIVTIVEGLCSTPFINSVGPFCDTDPTVTLSSSPPGGTWSGNAPSGIFDPAIGQGVHTVTYTSPVACPNSISIDIEVYQAPQVEVLPEETAFCEEIGFLELFANGTGGTGVYTYSWATPDGPMSGSDILATSEGTYTVTITDSNGCEDITDVTVIMNPTPFVTIFDPGIICEDEIFMVMQADPSGGLWYGTDISPDGEVYPNNLGPGIYSFNYVYIDAFGCEGNDVFDLEILPIPLAIASDTGPYCPGATIELFGDTDYPGDAFYQWQGPNGYTSVDQNPTDATEAGLYTLEVISAEGCISEQAFLVVEFSQGPDSDAFNSGPYCPGQLIELFANTTTAGNVITFQWSGPNGYFSTEEFPIDATDGGLYSVVITVDGCDSPIAETEVILNLAPVVTASNSGPYCPNENIELFADSNNGGAVITYEWTGPNGYFSSEQYPTNATESGDYSVQVIIDGCASEQEITNVTINQPTPPTIAGNTVFCEGTSTLLDAGGGYNSYSWSNADNTQTTNITTAGNYSVTVTDVNGCTSEAAVDVDQNPLPVPFIAGSSTFCSGGSSTLDAGAGYALYDWSTAENGQTITVMTSGNYSVIVTDANGCTGETDITVTENNSLTPIISGDTEYCEGENTILDAGSGFETYLWSDNDASQAILVTTPGTYSVTVSDINGCTGETAIVVSENPLPIVNISGATSFCEGENTLLSASGSFASYAWSDNSSGQSITVDATGTYSVTVTDAAGCTGENAIDVIVSPLPTPDITGSATFCEGSTTIIDAGAGYDTYAWSDNSNGQTLEVSQGGVYIVTVTDANGCTAEDELEVVENTSLSPQITGNLSFCDGETSLLDAGTGYSTYEWNDGTDTPTLSVDATGTYSVTVSDANGCTGEVSVSVSENPLPVVNISGGTSFCEGENTLLSASGSFATYAWSDNSSGQSILVDATGTYSVTVTDAAGCTGENAIDVIVSPLPTPNITGSATFCEGSTTIIDAGAGYDSYTWSDNSNGQTLEVSQGGVYIVTVTDANGCTAEDELEVVENTSLSPQITGTLSFCDGETSLLNAGTGYSTYEWNDGTDTPTLSVDATGTYSVTVSDANGCTGEVSISVSENPLPIVNILGITTLCQGETTTLSADGTFANYEWSDNSSGQDITVDVTGTYNVIVTDDNGCTGEASISVTVNSLPTPEITGSASFCEGSTTLIDAGSGYDSYSWSDNSNGQTLEVSQGGLYTVTVTDENGCTAEDQLDIIENSSLSPQITGTLSFCDGESTLLDAGNGYATYEWNDATVNPTLLVDATGTYSVTVSDSNGCTGEISVSVSENPLPVVNIEGINTFCEGGNTVLSTDGTFANYEWSDNSAAQSISVDAAGTYSVIVTDGNGCTGEASINVTLNPNPEPVIAGSTTFCEGSSTSLDAGVGYASYSWSSGSIEQTIVVTAANTFSVTVTDANGCTGVASSTVTESSVLNPVISGNLDFCEGESTLLNAGAGFDSYVWSDASVEQTLLVVGAGSYSVTVSDAGGCTGESNVTIVENSTPIIAISGNDPFCTGEDIELDAGAGFNNYLWSDQSLNQTLSVTTAGIYSVTVTDDNGCTAEGVTETIENNNPSPVIVGAASFCEGNEVILEVANSYTTYAWSDATSGETLLVNAGGTYTVTVSNSFGCTGETQWTVNENNNPEPVIIGELDFCEGESTTLSAPSGFTYEWSNNENTQDIIVNTTGQYSVLVTDGNGCTGTAQVNVVENPNPIPNIAGSTTFCTGTATMLDAGGGYSNYAWSDGSFNQTLEVGVASNYAVTVTDNNGCTGETQVTVTESTSLNPAISGDLQLCEGETSTLDAGAGFVTYSWSTGDLTQTISSAVSGDYSVTVSDASGCTGEGMVSLTVSVNPVAIISGVDSFCENENSLLDAGVGYANYLWSDGSEEQTFLATTTGTYGVTVTDSNSCTAESTLNVVENQQPVIDIIGPASFCSGNTTTLTVPGNYNSYEWSTGEITPSIDLTSGATVSVVITDVNGCTAEASMTVTENTELSPVVSGELAFCEGGNTLLDAGTGWATYEWSTGEMTPTITVSDGGNYGVIVTDTDGCSGSTNITIVQNQNPNPTIAGSTTFCTGSSTTLDAGNYSSWTWSTGDTAQSIVTDQPGNYSIIVTDVNGCTGEANIMVEESSSLNPVISGLPAFCENENTILDAGFGFATYLWSDGSIAQTLDINVVGDYSVTVSDASGCSGENTITIDVIMPPEATLQSNTEICNTELSGSTMNLYDLVLAGDADGVWEDMDDSGASGLFNNINFDGVPAGEYNFIYTTNSAITPCQEVSYPIVVTVLECACGTVSFFPVDPVCNNDGLLDLSTIINTMEPGVWSLETTPAGANPAILNGNLFEAGNSDAGEYTLEYQLTNIQPPNCPDAFTQSIIVDQQVSAGVANAPFTICADESAFVDLTDLITGEDVNGVWLEISSNPSQGNAFNETTGTFNTSGQLTGSYTFQYEVSAALVCPSELVEVTVEINEQPIAIAGAGLSLTCSDPVNSLDATGSSSGAAYSISWDGPGVLLDGNQNTLTPTIDAGGIYELLITNQLTGCTATDEVEVMESSDVPVALAGLDQELTCDIVTTILQPSGSYGAEYLIEWTGPGITAANMNDLNPEVNISGTYTLVVTLVANGCSSSPDAVEVIDNSGDPEVVVVTPLSSLDCNSMVVDLIGDSPGNDVVFEWTNSNGDVIGAGPVLTGVDQEGIYTLTVTSTETGCWAVETMEVVNNIVYPIVNIDSPPILDCNNTTVTLDGTSSQSGADITYAWSGPGISGPNDDSTVEAMTPGVYTLEVLNTSNGCSSELTAEVGQNIALPFVTIATPEELDCQVSEVTLDANGSSAQGNFTYQWLDNAGNEMGIELEDVAASIGTYTFVVTNQDNGCSNSANIAVLRNENIPQAVLLDMDMPWCAGESSGYVTISEVLGGTAPYVFSFDGAAYSGSNFYTDLPAGIYSLELEDANGCQWDTTVQIVDPLPLDINIGPDLELQLGDSAQIHAQIDLPANLIDTIIWSPADIINCENEDCTSIVINTFNSMMVSATVVDVNGCVSEDELLLMMDKNRKVFIPSGFSPNGDDNNDLFMIYADLTQVKQINYLHIFNRWGEEIFEAIDFSPNDEQFGWDGKLRGEYMNPGVMVYIAEIEFIDGHVEQYHGDVTLVR